MTRLLPHLTLSLAFLCLISNAAKTQDQTDRLSGSSVDQAAQDPVAVEPLVFAFYYPWYGSPEGPGGSAHAGGYVHWEGVDAGARQIASSTNYPRLGAYDSHDPELIAKHCQMARDAGIDVFIVSWWGEDSFEDDATPTILDICAQHGMKACLYYEQVPEPRSADGIAREFDRVTRKYADHPAYLKIQRDGRDRPVFFVYARALHEVGLGMWRDATARMGAGDLVRPVLIGDDFGDEALSIFEGAHSYAPMGDLNVSLNRGETLDHWIERSMPWWADHPRSKGRISTITIFPGYDDTKIRTPGMSVDRDEGELYERLWKEAIEASPDWVLITSFNEWHEGSEIEPSVENGEREMETTREWAEKFKGSRMQSKN